MRTSMVKRYFCLLVVLLFVIPSVTALYDENGNNNPSKDSKIIDIKENVNEIKEERDPISEFFKGSSLSKEVNDILEKYSWEELDEGTKEYLVRFNKKMLERRKLAAFEYPDLPYIPLDITKTMVKIDPETNEMSPMFPDAKISNDPQFFKFDYNPRSTFMYSLNTDLTMPKIPHMNSNSPNSQPQSNSNTRSGSRAAPEADLDVTMLEWTAVNEGWGNYFEAENAAGDPPVPAPGDQYFYGGFQIGKTTTIKATIVNTDYPGVNNIKAKVNFTVIEANSNIPMMRRPTTKEVTISGAQTEVETDFVPPFAGRLLIQATVDYENDPDTTNNGAGWIGMPVFIWSADFESSGTNYGWQKLVDGTIKSQSFSDWTGDTSSSATADNLWHITNTPSNKNINEHTSPNAWYHGKDGVGLQPDSYEDDINRNMAEDDITGNVRNHTYLETPVINMGDISDGQEYYGTYDDNTINTMYTPYYGFMGTGVFEGRVEQNTIYLRESDFVNARKFADDPAGDEWIDWGVPLAQFLSGIICYEFEQWWNDQTTPHWNYLYSYLAINQQAYHFVGYPFHIMVGDGQGGTKDYGGAMNWSNPGVRYRLDYTGDGESDQASQDVGLYFDDFATWGIQDYVVEKRIGFTELTYPKTNGEPILYKDSSSSFSAKVKNYGKSQQVNIKVNIYELDENGNMGSEASGSPMQKNAGSLIYDQESTDQIFSWSPSKAGDYKLIAEAGDYDTDWTPSDNKVEFILHVSPMEDDEVDVLVVDDDDSIGGPGTSPWSSFNGIYIKNTEFKMLRALEDIDMEYNVYTVGYNETGPVFDIMSQYELVIWMTGLDNEFTAHGYRPNYKFTNPAWDVTLKTDDLTEIGKFLNLKDKKFWLISPGFIYDYYGGGSSLTAPSDFAREFLHIAGCRANVTKWNDEHTKITEPGTQNPLEGVVDTIMEGVEYTTYPQLDPPFDPPERFNDIGGWIEASDTDTSELFYQDDIRSNKNAVMYKGPNYMSAFFSFNFYLLSDADDRRDLVYRMLTGFEMTGGVIITPLGESLKTIYPGQEIRFQFTVENTGKKQDTMTLSVTKPSDYNDWTTRWEVDSIDKNTVAVPALSKSTKVYLYVAAPEFADSSDYEKAKNRAGTVVKFPVKAVSQLTSLDNSTVVNAKIGAVGNITLTCPQPTDVIEVKKTARFQLRLHNETNGDEDVTVQLSFDGAGKGLARFSKNGIPTNLPDVEAILEPNEENADIEIQVTAGEHTLAGYHNLTVYVKDEIGDITHDSVDLTIKVEQFYQVKCTTEGDIEDGEVNFTLDPNNYTDEDEDYIKKSFMINVRNYGNGYDEISLMAEENEDSEDTSDWLIPIISPDTEDNISSVNVGYYDVTKIPKYGEEEVQFDVYIPIDVDEGTYILDFIIQSSHTEVINLEEDETKNNILSFQFDIIKPNLQFTKFTPENADNFVFSDFLTGFPILRDYEYNNLFYYKVKHKDFDQLAIEFKISIDNIGDNEIDIEPSNIWLDITYQDEFGDTIAVERNMTPYLPTSAKLISPGENTSFTFLWEFIDQEEGSEIEYTFTVTVDPLEKIYETQEDDNSDEVQLTIKHEKKPKRDSGSTPGFETLIFIAAISIVIIALYDHRRRKK